MESAVPQPHQDRASYEEMASAVRGALRARIRDDDLVEDLTQETIARVLNASPRLGGGALVGYAVVTARNLMITKARAEQRRRNLAHKVINLDVGERPEDVVLRKEVERAVGTALQSLSPSERDVLMAHEVLDVDTATLAKEEGSSPGAIATKLARARAKLRVEYVIAFRGARLPTARCRPVLMALSAGDGRRQTALDAGGHIVHCEVCAGLSVPLLERRRSLAAVLPLAGLNAALSFLTKGLKTAQGQIAAGAAGITAAAAVVVSVLHHQAAPPPVLHSSLRTVTDGHAIVAGPSGGNLGKYVGRRVVTTRARVAAVPSDEGFWVMVPGDSTARIWVHLRVHGESRMDVDKGDVVALHGRIAAAGARPAHAARVPRGQAAARLRVAGYYLSASRVAKPDP